MKRLNIDGAAACAPITFKQAQEFVGGLVEVVRLPGGRALLVNEEGIGLGLARNPGASKLAGCPILGPAILCETREEADAILGGTD